MELILASTSPRRKSILDLFGVKYTVDSTDIEENLLLTAKPHINAMTSAYMKANSVYEKNKDTKSDMVIIGADTIVSIGDFQFGKPKNDIDQFRTLKFLSGNVNTVITGYAIVKDNFKYVDYVKSTVTFKELSDDMIRNYIATGEGMDKAGSYTLQGISSVFVKQMSGDYFNVIGLPISDIYDVLKNKFSLDLLDFKG